MGKIHFLPEARAHLNKAGIDPNAKIILLLDNCAAHPPAEELEALNRNFKVIYLPPNVTALCQPQDQGILRSWKCKYKSKFLSALLDALNRGMTIKEFLKSYNVRDAVFNIHSSWQEVTEKTLQTSWHKLSPPYLRNDDSGRTEPVITIEPEQPFLGFGNNDEERSILENLLEYNRRNAECSLSESNIVEVMDCDLECPTTVSATDEEIMNMALNDGSVIDEASIEDDSYYGVESAEAQQSSKAHIDDLIEMCNNLIHGLESKRYINDLQILSIHAIKDALIQQKPKLLKQQTIGEIFKKFRNKKSNSCMNAAEISSLIIEQESYALELLEEFDFEGF